MAYSQVAVEEEEKEWRSLSTNVLRQEDADAILALSTIVLALDIVDGRFGMEGKQKGTAREQLTPALYVRWRYDIAGLRCAITGHVRKPTYGSVCSSLRHRLSSSPTPPPTHLPPSPTPYCTCSSSSAEPLAPPARISESDRARVTLGWRMTASSALHPAPFGRLLPCVRCTAIARIGAL